MRPPTGSSRAWPLLIVLGAIAIQLRGIVLGRVLFFEDVAAYFEPLWTAASAEMRAGRLPTWALGAWSGQPLLGDPQIGVLYPPHWLWLVLAPARVYALSVLGHSLLAAGGAWMLARTLGRSRPAAAVAALSLSLSAFFVLEARHVMFLESAAWMPWLLVAIARHGRSGSSRSIAAIAATSALSLLAGGWSMLIFAAPVVLVFAIVHAPRLGVIVGGLLGVALAGIELGPAIAHAAVSPRALPLSPEFASSYAWPSLRYAQTLVFPLAYGDDARGTYVGAPDQWELCGYGSGLVVALLALVALRTREHLAYGALVVIAVLLALGDHGPLAILQHLPLLSHARGPARALFMYTLVAPMLAAAGVDALPRWAKVAPVLVALELLVTFRAENPTMPLSATVIAPAAVGAIPRLPTDGRTLVDVHLGQAFHNGGLRWGIESPSGYSSLPLWRYLHLCWIANHRRVYGPRLADDLTAQGLWTLDSPIIDLLNVRWLLAPKDRPPAGTGWVREDDGAMDGVARWRNEEAMSRGFVVHTIRRVANEHEAAEAMTSFTRDTAIVEDDVPVEDHAVEAARMIAREGPDVRFAVTNARGLFVFAEPYEPSWTVRVDGIPKPLLRVDYALMGVALEAGTHEVAFVRVDRPLRIGASISALALLLVVIALRRKPR